jgi:hypothetical protein
MYVIPWPYPNTLTVILDSDGNIMGGFTPVMCESHDAEANHHTRDIFVQKFALSDSIVLFRQILKDSINCRIERKDLNQFLNLLKSTIRPALCNRFH